MRTVPVVAALGILGMATGALAQTGLTRDPRTGAFVPAGSRTTTGIKPSGRIRERDPQTGAFRQPLAIQKKKLRTVMWKDPKTGLLAPMRDPDTGQILKSRRESVWNPEKRKRDPISGSVVIGGKTPTLEKSSTMTRNPAMGYGRPSIRP